MKKCLKVALYISLILICSSYIRAEEKSDDNDFDFRKTRWGMSFEEVKKAETSELISESTNVTYDEQFRPQLRYKGKYLDYDCYILYYFINNKLAHAGYVGIQNIREVVGGIPRDGSSALCDFEDFEYFAVLFSDDHGPPKKILGKKFFVEETFEFVLERSTIQLLLACEQYTNKKSGQDFSVSTTVIGYSTKDFENPFRNMMLFGYEEVEQGQQPGHP